MGGESESPRTDGSGGGVAWRAAQVVSGAAVVLLLRSQHVLSPAGCVGAVRISGGLTRHAEGQTE